MALVYFPSGLGESLGDIVATCQSLYTNAEVWYVDSQTGKDTYAGVDRLKPFATVAYAVTQSSEGDIILCLSGHTETVTSVIDIDGITIVGAGQADGKPTVKFQNDQAAGSMFASSEGDEPAQLLNLWLQQEAQANSTSKVRAGGAYTRIRGCYIECGQYDDAAGLGVRGTDGDCATIVQDTTIVSVGTALDAQPYHAIGPVDVGGPDVLRLENVTIDSGTVGWEGTGDESTDLDVNYLYIENLTLIGGADMAVMAGTVGYIHTYSAEGGSHIDWTAK